MDRSSKSTFAVVFTMIAVFVGVIGTVAWMSLVGQPSAQAERTQPAVADPDQRVAEVGMGRQGQDKSERNHREREAAAKAGAERLAREKVEEDRKKEEDRVAAARKMELDAEAERVAARAKARETVSRQKRRRALLANRGIPPAKFNPVMCAEKSAAAFESSFFEDAPDSKSVVHFFDVSTADGSLIVHLTKEAAEATPSVRKAATDVVVRAWRNSVFTRNHRFSPTVEFRYGDTVMFTEK